MSEIRGNKLDDLALQIVNDSGIYESANYSREAFALLLDAVRKATKEAYNMGQESIISSPTYQSGKTSGKIVAEPFKASVYLRPNGKPQEKKIYTCEKTGKLYVIAPYFDTLRQKMPVVSINYNTYAIPLVATPL